jgi:hypothetical protein
MVINFHPNPASHAPYRETLKCEIILDEGTDYPIIFCSIGKIIGYILIGNIPD